MIALARKYRPQQFTDLIAQDHVAAALRGAVAQGRWSTRLPLCRPPRRRKTTAARISRWPSIASAVPRRQPASLRRMRSVPAHLDGRGQSDVVELDAASNRGVDDARDLASGDVRREHRVRVQGLYSSTRRICSPARRGMRLLKSSRSHPPRRLSSSPPPKPQKIRQHRRARSFTAAALSTSGHRPHAMSRVQRGRPGREAVGRC